MHCPTDLIRMQEKERGNRRIGQAKKQLEHFHKNEIYDIEVNTFDNTISECANMVKNKLEMNEFGNLFLKCIISLKMKLTNKPFTPASW